jgi:hypothetical protein
MIQIAGQLQEVGGSEELSAVIVQPGTTRELTITGLTVVECRELGKHLYEDVVVTLRRASDNG